VTQITLDDKAGGQNQLVLYLGTESGSLLRVRPRLNATKV